eukprot:comp20402_c0_seq1/m.25821 comp20402_c0_seq1/g.25821  ORF comp20402_c0_seq1/g.25821 comp20402_c0_seq1/m.25821 type:complete len:495 (-) comp20402_c0_seq1:402-1886(-)
MSSYKRVELKRYPQLLQRETPETRYWKKFKFPIIVKEFAAITSINFCPTKPYDFAVTSSTRVQIYSSNTNKVKKTISRFKDVAHSGCLRDDGQLIVAGDETGNVQVFTVDSRSVLRQFQGHLRPVHVARFVGDQHVMTCADDTTVRQWDVPSQAEVTCLKGHTDYVRTGVVNPASNDLWLTGSYDHTVKLWDLRSGECTMNLDHGAPVESVLMLPTGGLALSAGGNTVKVWDLMGGRLLHAFSNHQKTVTCMALDGGRRHLVTGSLDHHVKIYDVSSYKVTYTLKYPDPVMSVAVSPQDTHLVVGMASGLLSIRHRQAKKAEVMHTLQRPARAGTYRYFIRGKSHKPHVDDFTVEPARKKKLKPYDVFLKKFEYGNALDAALATKRPVIIASVVEELQHRGGLKIALSGRDESSLEPVLTFLERNVINPRFSNLLIDICHIVLDIYTPVMGQSMVIDNLLLKLRGRLAAEVEFQKKMFELMGALEILMAGASNQ